MIVWDTETTGLVQPETVPLNEQPEIIELAAIKLDDRTLKEKKGARLQFLCRPSVEKLPAEITKITRLTMEDLLPHKPFIAHYEELVDFFMGERWMCAHNLSFDRSLLKFELMRVDKLLNFPWPPFHLCTVEASYAIKNRRLHMDELHTLACGEPHKEAHRAMADVEALVRCVRWLRKEGHL